MKNKLTLLILTSILSSGVYAQEAMVSSGGNATGAGGNASYTVGQIVYTTDIGTAGSMAQGIQQPYEISVITAVEPIQKINLSFDVYPNPTTDFLTLSINDFENSILTFQLFDISGKLLVDEQILHKNTNITMKDLPKAIYLLKVNEHQNEIKTFKIIKN